MNDPSKILDGLLVLEYRAGSKEAFGSLVKKYHPNLCKHACYYTHDMQIAKDVVQDSWAVILKKLHTLKDPNLFGNWAYRIVTRKALNYLNLKSSKTSRLSEKEVADDSIEIDKGESLEIQQLKVCISRLSENQRIVLRLF